MQVANMFSSAQVSKSCWFTPSSHSQKLEIIPFYSHFPARTPSLFHLFFHFILLHLEIGNCVFGMILKKHGWFLAVCLRISLLPPQKKKKKKWKDFLRSPRGISSKKKNTYPSTRKNQAVCSRFTFSWGGTLSLSHGGCPTTWICEATILFCRVESSVGGEFPNPSTGGRKVMLGCPVGSWT